LLLIGAIHNNFITLCRPTEQFLLKEKLSTIVQMALAETPTFASTMVDFLPKTKSIKCAFSNLPESATLLSVKSSTEGMLLNITKEDPTNSFTMLVMAPDVTFMWGQMKEATAMFIGGEIRQNITSATLFAIVNLFLMYCFIYSAGS